ncbi:MAG: hypothetical protein ACOYKD_04245 [Anaerolineaceae bacterium]|jgi:hypothetical protein
MKFDQLFQRARNHLQVRHSHSQSGKALRAIAEKVALAAPTPSQAPVIFFNASTRLTGMSLNAGFSLISAWSLRLQGVPVVNFACERGMTQCVLGTHRSEKLISPLCRGCIQQSDWTYSYSDQVRFQFDTDPELDKDLIGLDLPGLMSFVWQGMPLGKLVLPSARWILRRHHLVDDPVTRQILYQYIRSAWNVAQKFTEALEQFNPQSVVVFNGMQYPEAAARWVARKKDIPVFSHEVGLRPMSAFFTEGDATAYPLSIPSDFELSPSQMGRLNAYLDKRFKGNFHMAGVQFWPKMNALDSELLGLTKKFIQVVPVFTNVIFDTSQPHANVIFEDMFLWLDEVLATARRHPDTLFIIRAHPDEARKGKTSEESVAEWARKNQIEKEQNIRFIPPEQYVSSYDLIRMAKLVLIYNSTIGLEAAILGKPVLAAGRSRYSQADTVWLPPNQMAYHLRLEGMLGALDIEVPARFARNARRFLYYQLYRSSLSFDAFLEEDGIWQGYVKLKNFPLEALHAENSPALRAISEGILHGGNFLLKEDD